MSLDRQEQVNEAVKSSSLMNAIKLHRQLVPGIGLKESKDCLDAVKASLHL